MFRKHSVTQHTQEVVNLAVLYYDPVVTSMLALGVQCRRFGPPPYFSILEVLNRTEA